VDIDGLGPGAPACAGTWRYATRLILDRTSIAVPLAAPAARIRVADLVP